MWRCQKKQTGEASNPNRRMAAGQHRCQGVRVDFSVQAEIAGGITQPLVLGLTAASVIVLGAFGDLLGVSALLARADLPDEEHQRDRPSDEADPSRVVTIPVTAGSRGVCTGSRSIHDPVVRRGRRPYPAYARARATSTATST
jgi:hypothetical protein